MRTDPAPAADGFFEAGLTSMLREGSSSAMHLLPAAKPPNNTNPKRQRGTARSKALHPKGFFAPCTCYRCEATRRYYSEASARHCPQQGLALTQAARYRVVSAGSSSQRQQLPRIVTGLQTTLRKNAMIAMIQQDQGRFTLAINAGGQDSTRTQDRP